MARKPNYLVRAIALVAVVLTGLVATGFGRAALHLGERPRVDPPAGFEGDVSQPPRLGVWRATGTYTEVKGYLGRTAGERIVRRWTTARRCSKGACSYYLTREMANGPPTTARLTLRGDGWRATFPQLRLQCNPDGTTWEQHTEFVFRFTDRGAAAQAREVHDSYDPGCGYGVSRVAWQATLARDPGDPPRGDGAVRRGRGPVNGIGEREMGSSVGQVVALRMRDIERRVADALGREVELIPGLTDCRSRENTPSRSGAAFECLTATRQMKSPGGYVTVGVLVTHIEGRCWRGVHHAVAPNLRDRLRSYPESQLEHDLAVKPLRGCA